MNKSLSFVILGLIFMGCSEEEFDKGEWEDYNYEDFYTVQGMVYKVKTYFSWRYLERSRDVYYMYHMDMEEPLQDVIKESTLFGLKKGSFIQILVHKDDPRINFYNGSGIVDPRFKTGIGIHPEDTIDKNVKIYKFE